MNTENSFYRSADDYLKSYEESGFARSAKHIPGSAFNNLFFKGDVRGKLLTEEEYANLVDLVLERYPDETRTWVEHQLESVRQYKDEGWSKTRMKRAGVNEFHPEHKVLLEKSPLWEEVKNFIEFVD